MSEAEKKPVPAVGVSFSIPIGKGDQAIGMTFQTHFPGDMKDYQMDALLDMYVNRAVRQQKIGRIPEIKASIRQHEISIKNIKEDVENLDRQHKAKWERHNRSGEAKLPEKDQVNRDNALINLGRFEEMLGKLRVELRECEALLVIEAPKEAKETKDKAAKAA